MVIFDDMNRRAGWEWRWHSPEPHLELAVAENIEPFGRNASFFPKKVVAGWQSREGLL